MNLILKMLIIDFFASGGLNINKSVLSRIKNFWNKIYIQYI